MKTVFQFILFLLLFASRAMAQEVDLNQAISIALEQNYDVRVAAYSYEIEENKAELGNAGFLPSVFLQANGSYSKQNTEVTFTNPEQPPISQDGATTIAYGASANLEYTLFNGGRRIHFLNQLQSLSEDARLRQRLAMENTTLQVSNRYLEALRLQEEVDILIETVELSQNRLERADQNYNYGNTTKLQVLNAEVDLRRDSINLAQTRLEYSRGLRNLYIAMGISADTSLVLSDEYELASLLDKQELLNKAMQENTAYLRARNSLYTAEENLDVAQSDIWPTLAANAAYQYQYSDFEANFLNTQENLGWNAGLTFRFNIFDGNRVQRNIANAKLNREIAEVEMERSRNEVVRLVNNAYDTYLTNLELLDISERNLELARTNYSRSQDAFATGQITGIELRNAQLNLSDAQTAIVRQRILTKLAELGLLYEAGILIE
jgi:outer membrane protein TolC